MSRDLSGTRDGAGHAIVIGSSLAGLTAAAVLARHMERVTVIERDRLPSDAQWRPGVAQSRHAHNLMAAGHQGLGQLFPGIQQELLDAQMVSVRVPEDMLMLAPGGWIPRFETGMTMMTGTRDIVDAVVRDRLRAEPKVTFLQEHEVVGLQGGPGDSVTGVRVRAKDKDAKGGWGEPEPMAAEFVVDAAGRKSRAPQWLGELGYDKPAESVVDAKTAYGTTVYEPPAGHTADWKCILLLATPENPRQGILNPIEDGRWMVSVSASGGNRPPTDHEGMLEGAKSLRHPVVYEAIKDATPVGPVYGSGRTENRWRHFEKLRRWPDRFLVIGDALAAFNPSYGQGMSVAVQSALLLDRMLESRGTAGGGTQRLRRALAKQVAVAWQLATAIDLHYPWAAEASPPDLPTRLGMRYVDRVGAAAPTDHDAARVVLELAQLLAAPTAVFRPRVLRSALRGPRGPVSTDPPRAPHGAGPARQSDRSAADAPTTSRASRAPGAAAPRPADEADETAPGADDRAISSPSHRKTRSS